MIEVTFQSLGRTARIWSAIFDMGDSGPMEALRVAFKHNARIVRQVQLSDV